MMTVSHGSPFLVWRRIMQRHRWQRRGVWFATGVLSILISYIPIRRAIAAVQAPNPQAILTLGGRSSREQFTAEFAQAHPNLPIWLSSGMAPDEAQAVFRAAAISDQRLHLDYRAVDTVTNFTTLVDDLERRHIHHIYLITSNYHMPRATAIATIVLGSRGITFTAIAVPSSRPPESRLRILRDITRSLVWLVTRQTGASFVPTWRQMTRED